VRRWDGVISIRSGRARIADVSELGRHAAAHAKGMRDFPGAQITIILPDVPMMPGELSFPPIQIDVGRLVATERRDALLATS
jgi:hypothetical protein